MEDAGKEISLSHLKNISTQTNRIPKIDVNVPKIGSTFKSSDIYVDMSKVDSAYIMGHVNQINPTAKYFKDLKFAIPSSKVFFLLSKNISNYKIKIDIKCLTKI